MDFPLARISCFLLEWFYRSGGAALILAIGLTSAQSYRDWAAATGVGDDAASDDRDRDGLTHLMEYALGKQPQTHDDSFCLSEPQRWVVTKGSMAAQAGNMRWIPEVSRDLRSWTLPTQWSETTQSLTVSKNSAQQSAQFFRLSCKRLTHPQAVNYALATGLSGTPLDEVSDLLYELEDCGLEVDFLLLHGTRYRARQNHLMRAVIGGTGTIQGNITDEDRSQVFDGSAAWIDFANPAQSAALPRYSLFAIASTTSTTRQSLVASSWASDSARGPRLMFNASSSWGAYPGCVIADVNGGTATSVSGWSSVYRCHSANQLLPICVSYDAQTALPRGDLALETPAPRVTIAAGIGRSAAQFTGLGTTVWNDNARWRIGANLNGGAYHQGKIALTLITRSAVIAESVYQRLATAAIRAKIIPSYDQRAVLVCDGDSVTEGAGSPYSAYGSWSWPAQLFGGNDNQSPGGQWSGQFSVRNIAVGGRAIASSEAAWQHTTRHILARSEWGLRYYFTMISHNQSDMGSAANVARLERLWQQARELGALPVCIGLVPTQTTDPALQRSYQNTNLAIQQRAANNNIPFVDLSSQSHLNGGSFASGSDFFYLDAIHLTEKGYRLIAQEIAAALPFPGSLAPRSLQRPSITGPMLVDTDAQTNRGIWAQQPEQFTYQWMRNATDIAGATAAFYRITAADRGARLSCRITAINASGRAERTSQHGDVVR